MTNLKVVSFILTLIPSLVHLVVGYAMFSKTLTLPIAPEWLVISLGVLVVIVGILGIIGSVVSLFATNSVGGGE